MPHLFLVWGPRMTSSLPGVCWSAYARCLIWVYDLLLVTWLDYAIVRYLVGNTPMCGELGSYPALRPLLRLGVIAWS
jgi:hypothetical protein